MYDHSVYKAMALSGQQCPQSVANLTNWLQNSFETNRNIETICKIFNIDQKVLNTTEFLLYFASIFALGVQNGDRINLCKTLNSLQS